MTESVYTIAAELLAVTGDALDDHEFAELVDRIAASRTAASASYVVMPGEPEAGIRLYSDGSYARADLYEVEGGER
jgi:hypothetical protein